MHYNQNLEVIMSTFEQFAEFGEDAAELATIADNLVTFIETSNSPKNTLVDILEKFRDILDVLADDLDNEDSDSDSDEDDDDGLEPKEDLDDEEDDD